MSYIKYNCPLLSAEYLWTPSAGVQVPYIKWHSVFMSTIYNLLYVQDWNTQIPMCVKFTAHWTRIKETKIHSFLPCCSLTDLYFSISLDGSFYPDVSRYSCPCLFFLLSWTIQTKPITTTKDPHSLKGHMGKFNLPFLQQRVGCSLPIICLLPLPPVVVKKSSWSAVSIDFKS